MLNDLVMRGLAPTGPGTARLGTHSQRPNKGRNMRAMMHFDGKYNPALMGTGRLGSNSFGAQEQFSRPRRSATSLRVVQAKAAGEYRYRVSRYVERGRSNRRMSNFTNLL